MPLPQDKFSNALNGLQAMMTSQNSLHLGGIAQRLPRLVARLTKFSFPDIAATVGGLLTMADNHPKTYRLEVLVNLAAIHCRGTQKPTLAQLREWLNEILLQDAIGQLEDPVEDVFISNVPSWQGNARLFDGLWADNDSGVKVVVAALMCLKDEAWAETALAECMALLRLSEAVADRAKIARYTLSDGDPKTPVRIVASVVDAGRANVVFTDAELSAFGLGPLVLGTFALTRANIDALPAQTLGHTDFERRPLIPINRAIVVALPTALGAAIRRRAIEAAHMAGALDRLEALIARDQFQDLFHFSIATMNIDVVREPEDVGNGIRDVVGRFDEGGYVHVVYIADALDEVRADGLLSVHNLVGAIDSRVDAIAQEYAARGDYQRGLTLLVHGGVGRGFAAGFHEPPTAWQRVGFTHAELTRLAWDHDFDALRVWKITDQEDAIAERGYVLSNINGFVNLYGFMYKYDMAIVPGEAAPGMLGLGTNYVTEVRHRLRSALDAHVAMNPAKDRWVELQRSATEVYFRETRDLPLFVSRGDMASGLFLSCVETKHRAWWVQIGRDASTPQGRTISFHLWDMAQNWLLRAAPRFERVFPGLPHGPIGFRIVAPEVDDYDADTAFRKDNPQPPNVKIEGSEIIIECPNAYLRAFGRAENVGDRMMLAAMVEGVMRLTGQTPDATTAASLAAEITGSNNARFFHMLPPTTPSNLIQASISMPRQRLVQLEDIAWSRLGLMSASGWLKGEGPLAEAEAPSILNGTVDMLWKRIAARMATIQRESLIVRALANHDAIDKDRTSWNQTAAAQLALYDDTQDVVSAANRLEGQRGVAGLTCRIVVEMAVCTCPLEGRLASNADLDALVADVAALLECANESDAIHWGLATAPPVVNPNGSLSFDRTFTEGEHRPYLEAHGERGFRDAAEGYADAFRQSNGPGKGLDPKFEAAITDEFGIGLSDFAGFAIEMALEAVEADKNILILRRSEVEQKLASGDRKGQVDAAKAFKALTLKPRSRWDQPKPKGAEPRDWYPWRFNRRLSLLQRPMVQLDDGPDPRVVVLPTLVDRTVVRLFGNLNGLLPGELFDSPQLKAWIGGAVDRGGHRFNKIVAERMRELGFEAWSDIDMTALGGTREAGDVDVLAWNSATGVVLAIECKRLHFARSVGEIGERLAEYTTISAPGDDRTPIQKHLDRLAHLHSAPGHLARYTKIEESKLRIRSGLVTDYLVPMQFSSRAMAMLDIVTDVAGLPIALGVGVGSC